MSADAIRRHQSYEPEAYHELIDRQSSYATLFVAISPAEAAAVLAVYGARFINRADACTKEHLTALQNLSARVEKVLADSASAASEGEKKEYFVRLSSRSPKDGIPLGADQLRQALTQLMQEHGMAEDVTSVTAQPTALATDPTSASLPVAPVSSSATTDESAAATTAAAPSSASASASASAPSSSSPSAQEDEGAIATTNGGEPPQQQTPAARETKTQPTLRMEYDELLASGMSPKQMNDLACAAFALMHAFMRVSTANEVLALLTSSERVAIDLSRALDAFAEDPSSWRQHICLRAWERRIQDRFEFRCFVHENRLTAISQYNTYVCIDELADDADFRRMVFSRLVEEWKQNFQHVLSEIGSYVCDLAYCRETDDVLLIELNPPEPTTGSGLFDWQRDAHILTGEGHTAARVDTGVEEQKEHHSSTQVEEEKEKEDDKVDGDAGGEIQSQENRFASTDSDKPTARTSIADMTIEGEASSAVYVQDMVGGVVCRARPHAPPLPQLAGLLHMFVGETIRELHGPRERSHYTLAMESLHSRIWADERQDAVSMCSQKIQCAVL